MKKQYFIAIVSLVTICIVMFFLTHFYKSPILSTNGYFVSSYNVSDTLLSDKKVVKSSNVTLKKLSAEDSFYTNLNKLYVGNKKKELVNDLYPIFSNNGNSIVNINNKNLLINNKFQYYDTYLNCTITDGRIYNYSDLDQADYEEYLFMRLTDGTYINLIEMNLNTLTEEYIVPSNSIINFEQGYLKYYSYDKSGKLVYHFIDGISFDNNIKMNDNQFTYEKLLVNIGKVAENDDYSIASSDNDSSMEDDYITESNNGTNENKYVKPKVSVSNFNASVYMASATLNISDPSKAIIGGINFQFKKGNNVFLRRTFTSSGNIAVVGLSPNTEFTIIGSYMYYAEDNKQVEVNFFEQTIKTKGVDQLEKLQFNFSNGNIYSNKLEIKDLSISSNLKNENIYGINKIIVYIDNEAYTLSTKNIYDLVNGKSIVYTTPNSLKSNTNIDYQIRVFDAFSNEIDVANNKGSSRTSKEAPKVTTKIKNSINSVSIDINLKNDDLVNIGSFRYNIYNNYNEVVESGKLDNSKSKQTLEFKDLDPSTIYKIVIIGDYDTENGQGVVKNNIMSEEKFSTLSIDSLGSVRVVTKSKNLTANSNTLVSYIDVNYTNHILNELLYTLTFEVKDTDDNIIYKKVYSDSDLDKIKSGEEFEWSIDNLDSKTKYNIYCYGTAKQGNTIKDVIVKSTLDDFKTLKQPAKVKIKDAFSSTDMIIFKVKIDDYDGAILSDDVLLEVRDKNGTLISMERMNINRDSSNEQYKQLSYNKLIKDMEYTFTFQAESYNEGYDSRTLNNGIKVLCEEKFSASKLTSSVNLLSLVRQVENGRNLFNIKDKKRIRKTGSYYSINYDLSDDIVMFSTKDGSGNFAYYTPEILGQDVTVSFSARYNKKNTNKGKTYITNGYQSSLSSDDNKFELQNIPSASEEWKKYTIKFKNSDSEYIGFLIESAKVDFKDIKIYIGNYDSDEVENKYEESDNYKGTFSLDINNEKSDKYNFYIRVYNDDKVIKTISLSELDNGDGTYNKFVDEFSKNQDYKVALAVEVNGDYYDISETSFNTGSEIRGIRTLKELESMHDNGKYLVLNDIDIPYVGDYTMYGTFNGELDFQGYVLNWVVGDHNTNYLFEKLSDTGKIKNIVLNYKIINGVNDNYNSDTKFGGMVSSNYGDINNIMVNINQKSDENLNYIKQVGFISLYNYGTINKFVVNNNSSLFVQDTFGLVSSANYGVVKNGYVYGNELTKINDSGELNRCGVILGSNYGTLKNVYSLISFSNIGYGAYLVGNNGSRYSSAPSVIQNAYSAELKEKPTISISSSPNIDFYRETAKNDVYYYNESWYDTSSKLDYFGDYKISSEILHNKSFQTQTINGDNSFNISDTVTYGYFPQVKFNDSMPNQDFIYMPTLDNSSNLEIVSSKQTKRSVEEQDDENKKYTGYGEVELIINNPLSYEITGITINGVIVEINKEKGQFNIGDNSIIEIKVFDSNIYGSSYNVSNIEYKIGDSDNIYNKTVNQKIDLELYYPIYNKADWKRINDSNKSRNYMLMDNLDFDLGGNDYIITGSFNKLDGQNKVLSNIEIRDSKASGFIEHCGSVIENLKVEHFLLDTTSVKSGFIGDSSISLINNVHLNDVTINGKGSIGGILGKASILSGNDGKHYVIISNSSVTNFKSSPNDYSTTYVGAIAGDMNGEIVNSYVANININVNSSLTSDVSVGGIVGRFSGKINNVYATGNINSSNMNIGGVVGYLSGSVYNAWTNVNINSKFYNIGGIVGYASNSSTISNTLVVGDVFSSYNYNGDQVFATVGNSDNFTPNNNYVWDNQKLNGESNSTFSIEDSISTELLGVKNTYYTLLDFKDSFSYDNIENFVLPKINSTDGYVLPDQEDSTLVSRDFGISKIVIENQTENSAVIKISVIKPSGYSLIDSENSIKIDGLFTNIDKIENDTITLSVTPDRYYDNYTLTRITFIKNGVKKSFYPYSMINLRFYGVIENVEDWQKISTTDFENYKVTKDLDLSTCKDTTCYNKTIGRLEGDKGNNENIVIKGLNINSNTTNTIGLISGVKTLVSNVTFSNITIKNTKSITGVINNLYGVVRDCKFNNINISSSGSYIAPISKVFELGEFSNIECSNNTITGNQYVGGLVGHVESGGNSENINAESNVISGNQYVGGVVGYSLSNELSHYVASEITINGKGFYIGGVFGRGNANSSIISDSSIIVDKYYIMCIGGFSGGYSDSDIDDIVVTNCNIKVSGGETQDIGGAFGSFSRGTISNVFVSGDNNQTSIIGDHNVGGVIGWLYDAEAINIGSYGLIVSSNGWKIGGLVGQSYNVVINNSYVVDVIVRGSYCGSNSYVGGLVGHSSTITINNSLVKSNEVRGIKYVGGLVGYAGKLNVSNVIVDVNDIYGSIDDNANNSKSSYVGGLSGSSLTSYENVLLVSNINVPSSATNFGPVTGLDKRITEPYNGIYMYNNNKIIQNGSVIEMNSYDVISNNNYNNNGIDKLKTTDYYTETIGLNGNYFNIGDINDGYYPRIKDGSKIVGGDLQPKVLLPEPEVSASSISTMSLSRMRTTMLNHELPNLDVYSSGVNTLNIEFDKEDSDSYFSVYEEGKKIFEQKVLNRCYSINYNYKSNIKIVISDGINEKVETYTANDLINKVTTFDDKYAYIYDDELMGNVISTKDKFIHVFGDKALTSNLDVYDLSKGKFISHNNNFSVSLLGNPVHLYSFVYNDIDIDTYGKYSIIHSDNGDVLFESQLFVKNGTLEMVDGTLDNYKNSIIVDNYSNKYYVTILGNDNIIYDLKDNISLPQNFSNKNIEYMSNNINSDTSTIVVMYDNGKVVVFDYRTGRIIDQEKVIEDVSIIDYFKSNLISSTSLVDVDIKESYNDSLKLKQELEKNPITTSSNGEFVVSDNQNSEKDNNSVNENSYITYYDSVKRRYDVVNIGDVLYGDDEKIYSESDKIYSSSSLINIYMKESIIEKIFGNVNVIAIFVLILVGIIFALLYWVRNVKMLKIRDGGIL